MAKVDRLNGKTCDLLIDADTGAKCGKPAAQEFVSMPVAGPHGVCEFLPGARSAFLCAKHAKELLAHPGPISIGGR